jgi:Ca2+-binding EF-hand superfamily protein
MRHRAPWVGVGEAAGLVVAGVLVAAAAPAGPPEVPGTLREAVFFGPAGPVRIRLHVTIGGRPAEAAWRHAVGTLFAFLDRDGNGVLDAKERAFFEQPRRGRQVDPFQPEASAPRLTFGDKDEGVTREALAAALRAAGLGPVRLASAAGRPDSAQLSAALFRHLDRDGDGKLSADEVRAAREQLAPLDINEDELLTPDELLVRPAAPGVVPAVPVMAQAPPQESPDFLFLDTDGTAAVKLVLAARGSARATSLRRTEFGADAARFAALDKDGNGRLDTAELAAWLRQAPDVDLALALAPGGLTLLPMGPGRAAAFRVGPDGAVVGSTAGTDFRFEHPGDGPERDATGALRQQLLGLAKPKGFVTRQQLEDQPALLALFDFADRNADGKVDAAELESAAIVLAVLAACGAEVTFVDDGNGLFELLDANGDGKLSPRELLGAAAAVRPFADATGRVGPKDLPRRLRAHARAAGIPAVVVPGLAMPATARRSDDRRPPPGGPVPAWFTLMDRNGDGDVSLREFLGPLELFRKLDRNGDGLISPEEARGADR